MQIAQAAPGARILGMGHHQPANVVTNADLIARGVETTDEWIQSRVGIAERRIALADESVVDMAEAAGSKAIAASGVDVSEIDLVIVATCTMTTSVPNAAAQLATRLGISSPGAFDVNAACAGFVYATAQANAAVLTGQARNVLVVGSEKLSTYTDPDDRSTNIIFADGAGAAVIGRSDEPGIGPVVWGSDGSSATTIEIPAGGQYIVQEGQAVFRWATGQLAPVAIEACARAGIDPSEIAAFIPHQANLRIIENIAKKVGAVNAVIARDIINAGNTSAASIPLAMSRMVERGEIPSGAPVLIIGFGAGLTFASQVVLAP
ncbi:MAG: 3-oxoacyl-ACP synthase [Jatrophihabitantaceae bacterium]|nr:3-oxoacyl-ACP synthase [Jatrophihabitantaceae bacterium]